MILVLTNSTLWYLSRIIVMMPYNTITATDIIYEVLRYGEISVRYKREEDITPSSVFYAKIGRKRNIIVLISNRPKTRLQKQFCFLRLSSSAMVSRSSPDKRLSIDTLNSFDSCFRESMLGYPLPDSHLEIAVRDTNSAAASSSCVRDLLFLSCCSFSLNSILYSFRNKFINYFDLL